MSLSVVGVGVGVVCTIDNSCMVDQVLSEALSLEEDSSWGHRKVNGTSLKWYLFTGKNFGRD